MFRELLYAAVFIISLFPSFRLTNGPVLLRVLKDILRPVFTLKFFRPYDRSLDCCALLWRHFSVFSLGIVGLPVPDEWLFAYPGHFIYIGRLLPVPAVASAFLGSISGMTCIFPARCGTFRLLSRFCAEAGHGSAVKRADLYARTRSQVV